MERTFPSLATVLKRNLIFVHGKGGVGKTAVSRAIALRHAQEGHPTLWISLQDPTRPPGEKKQVQTHLWYANLDFSECFEEYASMRIGIPGLTRLFLQNKLMRYLAKAAPGLHEVVFLGKIWHERTHYSHVVIDLPSTGYGLAMFQSTANFATLFRGGPLHKDAEAMLETFRDPHATAHLVLALPEEMPLQEALELDRFLHQSFPKNPAAFLVNRLFPATPTGTAQSLPSMDSIPSLETPLARTAEEYALRRSALEEGNLKLWKGKEIPFGELPFIPPTRDGWSEKLVQSLADQLRTKAYL